VIRIGRWFGQALPWRDTPVVSSVLTVYLITNILVRSTAPDATAIEEWASTNIVNLHDHPVRAIVASIFIGDGDLVPITLVYLAIAGAILERHAGGRIAATVTLLGHVTATVVTEGAVRAAIWLHRAPRSAAWQLDIGVSYLAFTAAAAALRYAPGRARIVGALALALWMGVPVVRTGTMTEWGHASCVAVGLLSWHWLPDRPPPRHALDTTNAIGSRSLFHPGKAVSATVVGAAFVAGVVMLTSGSRLLPPRAHHRAQSRPQNHGPLVTPTENDNHPPRLETVDTPRPDR
jgi:hypothetical protein